MSSYKYSVIRFHGIYYVRLNHGGRVMPYGIRQLGQHYLKQSLIARFMVPTWEPPVADRTQVGPTLVPWTLLSGMLTHHQLDTKEHISVKDFLKFKIFYEEN